MFQRALHVRFREEHDRPRTYETKHFAIYTKNDGVVEWQSCIEEDEELNTEVSSTHIGMAFHPGVYSAIGKLLAVA